MSQKFVSASMLNYSVQKVIGLINGKVDKVEGKGLSTNDLTEALKANYDAAYTHISNKENPHSVTAEQVGLGNVPNVTTDDQTPTFTPAATLEALVSGEKLSVSMGKIAKAILDEIEHFANKENPHEVTATQVGLGNVDNTADAVKSVAHATTTGGLKTAVKINGVEFDGTKDIEVPVLGIVDSALKDGKGQEIATTYIKNLDMSNNAIIFTKGDGTTKTFTAYVHPNTLGNLHVPEGTTDAKSNGYVLRCNVAGYPVWDNSYDYKVSGPNGSYDITTDEVADSSLLSDSEKYAARALNTVYFKLFTGATDSKDGTPGFVPAPPAGMTAGFLKSDGTWETMGSVDRATNDSEGQNIASTYIKNLIVSDNTIIYTKGNGVTGTIVPYVHPNTLGNLHVPEGTTDAKSNGYVLRCNVAGYPVWEPAYDYIPNGPEGSYEDKPNTKSSDESVLDSNKASSAICYSRTFKVFEGSTETKNGKPGFVPAPEMSSDPAYLRNDGTWEQFQTISTNDIDSMFEGTYQTN